MTNIYLELTKQFNNGKIRAVICSGQSVVLHQLAIMSKDGDWILREDQEAMDHVLSVLNQYGATYRFGAPLALAWMKGGWSAHFEFMNEGLRVRTDFFTRPPRISFENIQDLWNHPNDLETPYTPLRELALMKQTNREKDHAVIGEIARKMTSVYDQLLFSKSARDICRICEKSPTIAQSLIQQRPLLQYGLENKIENLEEEIDRERRQQIKRNENRLALYLEASQQWRSKWNEIEQKIKGLDLLSSHQVLVDHAAGILPENPLEIN